MSKIEVVSTLNTLNIGRNSYYYAYDASTAKYTPKVYLGTSQTIAKNWNYDRQNNIKYPSIWPEKGSQKGEANTEGFL